MSSTGELIDTERVTISSEGGRWKSAHRGNSLAAYPTASTVLETSRRGDPPAEFNTLREKYGKHTVFLGASFLAPIYAQHDGERGHLPERQRQLLPGETARKRLGIPMFLGEVH